MVSIKNNMKYIYMTNKGKGWSVQFQFKDLKISKYFSVMDHGTTLATKRAAIVWRDAQLKARESRKTHQLTLADAVNKGGRPKQKKVAQKVVEPKPSIEVLMLNEIVAALGSQSKQYKILYESMESLHRAVLNLQAEVATKKQPIFKRWGVSA
jgi:hypothetical protein